MGVHMCWNSFSALVNNISCCKGIVCFVVLVLKSAEIYIKVFWHRSKASLLKSCPTSQPQPHDRMAQMGMKCIPNIGKIFLCGPKLLRRAMHLMGFLFSSSELSLRPQDPIKCLHLKCKTFLFTFSNALRLFRA
jgi:hypothetical protein